MPLLAAFIGNLAVALAALFTRFVGFGLALKLAAYTAWMVVLTAFFVSVFVCMSALNAGMAAMLDATSGGWNLGSASSAILSGFAMLLGMFIPSNAGSVMACVASVWIACQVYKIQKQGMHNYSK